MKFSPKRYKAVALKEFLELRRNTLFFLMTFLSPVIFYFLFAVGFNVDAKHIPMGVVDLDKTQLSRSLMDSFQNATDLFNLNYTFDDYKAADRQMNLGNVRMILVIPHNFAGDIKAGHDTSVQVLIDAAYPNIASLVGANVDAIMEVFRYQTLEKFFATRPGFEAGRSAFTPIYVSVSSWYNPTFRSADFIIPGVLALVLIFLPPIAAAISLAREKETGSILNMYCSSIRKAEYLLGKMTPYVIIAYANLILFLLLSVYVYDVPFRGSITTMLISGFFYVATVIFIGLFISTLVTSQVAAILITFVGTVMPSFLYTGFFVPLSSMSESAQMTGYSYPTTYFIDLARKIMVKGVGFEMVAWDVLALVIFCVGMYALCMMCFKKRLG